MRNLVGGLALVAALCGAFALGRCTAPSALDGQAIDRPVSGSLPDPGRVAPGNAAPAAPDDGSLPLPSASSRAGAMPAPEGDPRSPHGPVAAAPVPDATSSPATGPQPLLQEDAPKLERVQARLASDSGAWRDLLELAAREEQDAEARRLEQRIAQTILRHGGHRTLLRLAPPHCTRSVCVMRGVGVGPSNDPRSDWLRLSSLITNEPWFHEFFDNARSSVSIDGADTLYITLYDRCEPGTCRFGRR